MANYIFSGTFISYFMTFCFIFSTIYGLMYYYNGSMYSDIADFEKSADFSIWDSLIGYTGVDFILEILSFVNPLIAVKAILMAMLHDNLSIYQGLNLFLLRPIGWIFTFIQSDYVLNKLRGISG